MNHYEELGVSRSATTAEIRQAYKALVRVLHPDQQQDENLRRLSELQLRRLNHLYQLLNDPDQRRRYDLSLQQYLPALRHSGPPPKEIRKEVSWSDISGVRLRLRINPGVAVWLLIGTIALGSGIVWIRSPAPEEPSRAGREHLRAADSASDAPFRRVETGDDTARGASTTQPQPALREPGFADEAKVARKQDHGEHTFGGSRVAGAAQAAVLKTGRNENLLPAAALAPVPERPSNSGVSGSEIAAIPPTDLTEPRKSADLSPPPTIPKAQPESVSGKWLYVPRPDDGKKSLYPPEYIELRVNNRAGVLRGNYRGRYRVSDRAISSEINFQFEGRQGETVSVLPWAGNNGSKGELRLKRLSDESIEVHWITTTFGQSNTLASGTAVLYRSDPP